MTSSSAYENGEEQFEPNPNVFNQYPLVAYFFLAYLITWVGVSPLVLSAQGLLDIQVSPNLHALGALGPILAALIVTAFSGGRQAVREFMGRLFKWRVGLVWMVISILSPFAFLLASAILLRAFGAPWPDFGLLGGAFAESPWVVNLLIGSFFYGFGEEPGWRGFALPRLQKNRSALSATAILYVFWALWHVPMLFYRFQFQGIEYFFYFFSMFFGALWFTFLYNSTGGSTLMVALWHTTWNIVNLFATVLSPDLQMVMNIFFSVVAVLVVFIGGRANLSRSGKHTI